MKKFELSLTKGVDTSMTASEFIDVFTLHVDGVPSFVLTYNHGSDSEDAGASVKRLTPLTPEHLPMVMSSIDLIGQVYSRLVDEISEQGCEFFAELFAEREKIEIAFS